MHILGISAYYHDSAACLLKEGKIVAAAQEERFSRIKHDSRFPERAIRFCLNEGNISSADIDQVAFYEQPALKFHRLLATYAGYAPRGLGSYMKSIPLWLGHKLWIKNDIKRRIKFKGPVHLPEHHASHSASAFFPSPFQRSAILTMDGVGEWTTSSLGMGKDNRIDILQEIRFPHSLGLLYSAFTYYTGFKVNSGEYKLMGLAPYGDPRYVDIIYRELIDLKEDGSFRLNMDYFNYCTGFTMTSKRFDALFGRPPRKPETTISQMDMDLASSIQAVTEEVVLRMGNYVHNRTGEKNLCLAGGVALNCVANGRLYREGPFDNIWIQPASGDAGGALGAALYVWHQTLQNHRCVDNKGDLLDGTYLGPEYSDSYIQAFLDQYQAPFEKIPYEDIPDTVAELIASDKVIGWFQGRMEFGPRALGSRSIIGDPRSPDMQTVMNLKIKYRESFRPFAPSVIWEKYDEWFDMEGDKTNPDFGSPYMLVVGPVKQEHRLTQNAVDNAAGGLDRLKVQRSKIPAVTHVDYSARIQTVHAETNELYHRLIESFDKKTGCPLIINTSFNVRGEPIVESPEDAYRCFMRTEMDYLIMGNCLLSKRKQPEWVETTDWRSEFELD